MKVFRRIFIPTALTLGGAFFLWCSLYSSIIAVSSDGKSPPEFFIVMYMLYFSIGFSLVQLTASGLLMLGRNGEWTKILALVICLPVILFVLAAGALSTAIAVNKTGIAFAAAVSYWGASAVLIREYYLAFRKA